MVAFKNLFRSFKRKVFRFRLLPGKGSYGLEVGSRNRIIRRVGVERLKLFQFRGNGFQNFSLKVERCDLFR